MEPDKMAADAVVEALRRELADRRPRTRRKWLLAIRQWAEAELDWYDEN